MKTETTIINLRNRLFADPQMGVYAVIDGASAPGLQSRIYNDECEYRCLFTGNLVPDLMEAAPYVVKLERESSFTDWILNDGWGEHWGIFAVSKMDIREIRQHLRSFLRVESPEGNNLVFRFYDPRVFRVFIPTCDESQLKIIFSEIEYFLLEGEDSAKIINFHLGENGLKSNLEAPVEAV